jgi:hypothetical protein
MSCGLGFSSDAGFAGIVSRLPASCLMIVGVGLSMGSKVNHSEDSEIVPKSARRPGFGP